MDYSLLVGIHEEDRNESDDDLDADVTNGRSDDSAEESPSSPTGERPLMGRSNSVTSGEVPMDGERYAVNSSRGELYCLFLQSFVGGTRFSLVMSKAAPFLTLERIGIQRQPTNT